jgi:acyl carrier protein
VTDIQERLEAIARNVFGDESIVLNDLTKPADVPGWDSLGHINFMFGVENEFAVQFNDDEFIGFETVGDLERMLDAKLPPV